MAIHGPALPEPSMYQQTHTASSMTPKTVFSYAMVLGIECTHSLSPFTCAALSPPSPTPRDPLLRPEPKPH